MIVIDASSVAKFILKEEGWRDVSNYLANSIYSLDTILLETTSAVLKHYRRKKINRSEMLLMLVDLEKISNNVIETESFISYLRESQDLSIRKTISIYDAIYLAQAKKKGELVTSDAIQYEIAKEIGLKATYI